VPGIDSKSFIEAHKESLLDMDPEDLEQIALLYDNVRFVRRKNKLMKGNSDSQLASDFDQHLKACMT
jgi:hypothetical protein